MLALEDQSISSTAKGGGGVEEYRHISRKHGTWESFLLILPVSKTREQS